MTHYLHASTESLQKLCAVGYNGWFCVVRKLVVIGMETRTERGEYDKVDF